MSFKPRAKLLSVVGGLALTFGLSGNASALTFGTIPEGGVNEGICPIYGLCAPGDQRPGYYGGQVFLNAGPSGATITVDYLGAESDFANQFWFSGGGSSTTITEPYSNNDWADPRGVDAGVGAGDTNPDLPTLLSTSFTGVQAGLLNFSFTGSLGSVVNGFNPDDAGGAAGSAPNFFASFYDPGPGSLVGTVLDLWFDDGGANNDDNHDDMMIRLTVSGGKFAVPIPAAVWLFGSALVGIAGIGYRRRAREA